LISFADLAGQESNQIRLPKLLVALGLAASNAEASRKIAEKAVKLDGESAVSALFSVASLPARIVVRLGKRAKVAVIA
jgi:tyrosyl-tRNA synthetase